MRYVLALAMVAGAAATTAHADALATFSYDDLAGTYVGGVGGGSFSAVAVDTLALQSQGGASRLVPSEGDAVFQPGFVSGADLADFSVTLSVGAIDINGNRAGAGSFIATDADGDTITGNATGTWRLLGNFLAFSGSLSNVMLNGTTFNGTDASSTNWDMDLPGDAPYDGAIVNLVFGASDFFNTSFADRATGLTAQIIPAPGALALLGLGGLVGGRRRR